MSYFNHEKYPIIVGATYVSKKLNDEGVLDAAELFRHKNEAEIIIKTDYHGRYYKLNYPTFCFDWELKK